MFEPFELGLSRLRVQHEVLITRLPVGGIGPG